MSISYNGLWKLLIDKNLKKGDLIERLEISSSTIAKMTKNEAVSLRILEKICRELDCDFGDIVHYVKDELYRIFTAATSSTEILCSTSRPACFKRAIVFVKDG